MLAIFVINVLISCQKRMQGEICKEFLWEFVNHKYLRQFLIATTTTITTDIFFRRNITGGVSNAGGL